MSKPDIPKIKSTTDYDKFELSDKNRQVNMHHVMKLKDSFEKEPELVPHKPILTYKKGKKYCVIDGQHTLRARELQGEPVYYTVLKGGSVTKAGTLNAARENWRLDQFLQMNAKRGFKDYKKVAELQDKYGLPLHPTISFLETKKSQSNKIVEKFKRDEFEMKYEKEYIQLAEEIERLSEILQSSGTDEPDFTHHSNFFKAYIQCRVHSTHDKLDFEDFERQVKKYTHVFTDRKKIKEYIRMFETVQNFRKSKNTVRFF